MSDREDIGAAFPAARALLGERAWGALLRHLPAGSQPGAVPAFVAQRGDDVLLPDYLPDLLRHEHRLREIARQELPAPSGRPVLNPTLDVVESEWRLAPTLRDSLAGRHPALPRRERERFLMWRDPAGGAAKVLEADGEYLFALKMLAEDLDVAAAAAAGGIHVDTVNNALCQARLEGIVIGPASLLRREDGFCDHPVPEKFNAVSTFVIQWHLTNACDLHCKHCYDRTQRSPLTMDGARKVLDDLGGFCRANHVAGHVCFSGGNPLLFPHFFAVYEEASRRGHSLSVMGNPAPRERVERICAIRKPDYFQVSLEGLPAHNDAIRGPGTFAAVVEFLGVLRDLEVPSAVMLTLTGDNIDQVLPLAARLRGHTNNVTFNRLSPVGEGADLLLPGPDDYAAFLTEYVSAAAGNPVLSYKDNLINVVLDEKGRRFSGCTGYGCGAAFNFLTVLPDGEVHACRKFHSPLGNVLAEPLESLYRSPAAARYRRGSAACRGCEMKPYCGGCLSVTSGLGGDPFRDRDPYCFFSGAGPANSPPPSASEG